MGYKSPVAFGQRPKDSPFIVAPKSDVIGEIGQISRRVGLHQPSVVAARAKAEVFIEIDGRVVPGELS